MGRGDGPLKKADDKFPPDRGDEPVDADEEWEEREKKGRVKKKSKPTPKPDADPKTNA